MDEDVVVPRVEGVDGGGPCYEKNDVEIDSLIHLKGPVDPTKIRTSDLVHVWSMPSTINIRGQEMPKNLEPLNLLAGRNERENIQIAIRPKVSWGRPGSSFAGIVQIQCSDLCSPSGDRLIAGKSILLRRVVPVLDVPDALVPLDLPVAHINLFPGETTALWLSIDVPIAQPPGNYEGEILITAKKTDAVSLVQSLSKAEKHQFYKELKECFDFVDLIDGKPLEETVEMESTIGKDAVSSLSLRLKLNLTVWEFILPETPSLPVIIGISDTVIEDRFGVKRGTDDWYDALDQHFKWLLQYRVSPYFCKWVDSMRVLTYTCPWPVDHPKSEEYFSDPRLTAYAVPYKQVVSSNDVAKNYLKEQIEVLKTKKHWKKAYSYLWEKPLHSDQYDSLRSLASEIHADAPDARILTTYFCRPNDAPLGGCTPFEAFLKVPSFLRPYSQIYCTSEWVLGTEEDLVKDITSELKDGEEWWASVCKGSLDPQPNLHLEMSGTQNRAVMWRVWKEGGTGFFYWGANCYEKATIASAEIKFRHGLPPGDGVLYYPGEVFSINQPVASIRLERLLSGLQDIEYLGYYASRYGRDEATSLLERMGVYLSPENYASDHKPIDEMRIKIFQSCTKKLPEEPKKMALLAGVPDHASNDVYRMQNIITNRYGFKIEDVCVMLEKPGRNVNPPTSKNIGEKLMELIGKSNKGDLILLYFVGHGGRYPDESGTKSTKHVEFLAAAEGTTLAGSTLKKAAEAVPEGVTFIFIAESCCSAGLIDGLTEVVGRSVNKWKKQTHKKIKEDKKKRSMFKGSIIMISSCQSFEQSWYGRVGNVSVSYFTNQMLNIVERTEVDYNYIQLVEEANRRLQVSYKEPPKEKKKKNQTQDNAKKSQHAGLYCDHELAKKLFLGGKSQRGTSFEDLFLGGRSTNF